VFDMMGGPRRAERGEVRYLILDAIAEGPRHGYDIMQAIESRAGGGYRPSAGTIYPTLQMLEEMGHVSSREQDGRRVYAITDAGRADLDAHREEVEEAYGRFGDDAPWDGVPDFHEIFTRIPRLVRTIGRGFRRGRISSEQFAEIHVVLDQATEKIEEILGGKGKRR
jgi:DNA-binding PadR family transcriptional regulator